MNTIDPADIERVAEAEYTASYWGARCGIPWNTTGETDKSKARCYAEFLLRTIDERIERAFAQRAEQPAPDDAATWAANIQAAAGELAVRYKICGDELLEKILAKHFPEHAKDRDAEVANLRLSNAKNAGDVTTLRRERDEARAELAAYKKDSDAGPFTKETLFEAWQASERLLRAERDEARTKLAESEQRYATLAAAVERYGRALSSWQAIEKDWHWFISDAIGYYPTGVEALLAAHAAGGGDVSP